MPAGGALPPVHGPNGAGALPGQGAGQRHGGSRQGRAFLVLDNDVPLTPACNDAQRVKRWASVALPAWREAVIVPGFAGVNVVNPVPGWNSFTGIKLLP